MSLVWSEKSPTVKLASHTCALPFQNYYFRWLNDEWHRLDYVVVKENKSDFSLTPIIATANYFCNFYRPVKNGCRSWHQRPHSDHYISLKKHHWHTFFQPYYWSKNLCVFSSLFCENPPGSSWDIFDPVFTHGYFWSIQSAGLDSVALHKSFIHWSKIRGDFLVSCANSFALKTRNFCVKKDTKHDLVSNETITIFIDWEMSNKQITHCSHERNHEF